MHPQVVKTGNAIDCVMGVARRSPFIQEKNHNLEALYTNIIQQAIYFIQQYKMLSYDAQVQNLKSKELESIIDLADRLPQKTHNIPSANRDNLLFIISHLDLVLKDQPF
jgi:tRNA A37 threonylcarbamoyladenosine dehydratase